MQLIDYSKDKTGEPGANPGDRVMYVITELGSYSLKEYLKIRRDTQGPLSKDSVWDAAKSILLITAGLHSKGLVHLDLKPENLMFFDDCLKLIDVDGCVKIGSIVSITDSSLSYSPCYCAPEWAAFLIKGDVDDPTVPTIKIQPSLDVWSIGMTICELVTPEPILKKKLVGFSQHGHSLWRHWLSALEKLHLPKAMHSENVDPNLLHVLESHLLLCDPRARNSLAQTLSLPYFIGPSRPNSPPRSRTNPINGDELEEDDLFEWNMYRRRTLVEDDLVNQQ